LHLDRAQANKQSERAVISVRVLFLPLVEVYTTAFSLAVAGDRAVSMMLGQISQI
jgi:hypothetical protein